MSGEQREETFFEAALQLPANQRATYLDKTCAGNADLRQRIEVLLSAFERAGGFMEQPAVPTPERTAHFSPLLTEKPGDKIGRYKVLEQIGEGGCGVVYVAEQEEPVRRRVALKVIKLGMDTKQVIARFDAERQALAMMDHPNIAKIFDAGATETPHPVPLPIGWGEGRGEGQSAIGNRQSAIPLGRPYFVMELVRGIKITDYCDQNHLPPRERLDLFIQVCRAIQHAHQKGVIHRDIKPSNILVTLHDGVPVPKVIDFGIAKATQGRLTDQTVYTAFEQFIGTPAYMSPEQAELSGLDIDTRSDIYSLGVLLYELLTGTTPFDAKELLAKGLDEMRRTIREVEPVKPSTRLTQEIERTHARKLPRPARNERGEGGGRGAADEMSESQTNASSPRPSPPSDGGEGEDSRHRQRFKSAIGNRQSAIPSDLDWIVMKCLEKDRTRRYETANGLATDIARHLSNEPIVARPPSRLYRFQKSVQRNKLAFGAATAVALALVIGFAVSTEMFFKAEAEKKNAQAEKKRAQIEAAKSKQVAQFLESVLTGLGPTIGLGRDRSAVSEILATIAERISKDLTNQPEVQVALRTTMARTYEQLGLTREMEKIAQENLQFARSHLGEENLAVADTLDLLGDAQTQFLNYDDAQTNFEQAVRLRRKLSGNEDPSVARSLTSLVHVLRRQAARGPETNKLTKLAEAEKIQLEALETQRELLPKDDPDIAASIYSLAFVLRAKDQITESEDKFREALAMQRKVLGDGDRAVADTRLGLVSVLRRQGKLQQAEDEYQAVLATYKRALSADHPSVAEALTGLAAVLKEQGKEAELEKLYSEAVERGHVQVLNNFAWNLVISPDPRLRNGPKAVALAEQAVAGTNRKNAGYLDTLAAAYAETGQFAQAVSIQEEAIALVQDEFQKREFVARRQLYERNSPYREPR